MFLDCSDCDLKTFDLPMCVCMCVCVGYWSGRMSWDSYITNLKSKKFVLEAAIWGCDKGAESKWAGGPGLDGITVHTHTHTHTHTGVTL